MDTLAINYNQKFWGNDHSRFNPHRFQHLSSTEVRSDRRAYFVILLIILPSSVTTSSHLDLEQGGALDNTLLRLC